MLEFAKARQLAHPQLVHSIYPVDSHKAVIVSLRPFGDLGTLDMNYLPFEGAIDRDRRVAQYLKSKPDREIAALLLQEVLPELSAFGQAGVIIESAIDRLVRANGGAMSGPDAEFKARRVALEESDASSELFQFTF